MSNMPSLSEEAIHLLILIDAYHYRGHGPRLPDHKARRELKKAGLISSSTINSNVLLNAASGGGSQWRPTPFARELAEAFRKEWEEEGRPLPTWSDPSRYLHDIYLPSLSKPVDKKPRRSAERSA